MYYLLATLNSCLHLASYVATDQSDIIIASYVTGADWGFADKLIQIIMHAYIYLFLSTMPLSSVLCATPTFITEVLTQNNVLNKFYSFLL